MSLQVWLPLNGDLHNQGLSNVTVTNNGATINDNGKIGKCYDFTDSQYIYTSEITALTNVDNGISLTGWFKLNNLITNQLLFGLSGSATSNSKIRLFWIASESKFKIYISGTTHTFTNENFSMDTEWHHYAITWNDSVLALYIDGIVIQTKSHSDYTVVTARNKLYINGSINYTSDDTNDSSYFTGSANDIRVYDHALSPKEVEEIAKGLVLHYKLDGENQILVPSGYQQLEYLESDGTQYFTLPTAIDFSIPFNLDMSVEYTSYDSSDWQPLIVQREADKMWFGGMKPSGGTFGLRTYNGGSTPKINTDAPAINTKLNIRLTRNDSNVFSLYMNNIFCGSATFNMTSSSADITFLSSSGSYNISAKVYYFNYNNSVILIPAKRLSDNEIGLYDIISKTFFTNAGTGTFTAGPNASITGIIYDSSGYSNNGTIAGSLTAAAGSPRYDVATQFPGNALIEAEPLPAETKTISAWIKWNTIPSGTGSSAYVVPIHDKNSGLAIGISAGGTLLVSYIGTSAGRTGSIVSCSLSSNIWYHIVVIKTGETTRDVYINNVKQEPAKNSYWAGDLDKFLIGGRHSGGDYKNYIDGQIVDVRVYVTALTPDQIKELYTTSMSIDSSGNIHARELVEL